MSSDTQHPLTGITAAFLGNRPPKVQKQLSDRGAVIASNVTDPGVTHIIVIPAVCRDPLFPIFFSLFFLFPKYSILS